MIEIAVTFRLKLVFLRLRSDWLAKSYPNINREQVWSFEQNIMAKVI